MTHELPEYPGHLGNPDTWRDLDSIDQYSRFDRLLMDAEKKQLFDALPDSRDASMKNAFFKRGETMAERLWLLGYIKADSKYEARELFHQNRNGFLSAISEFQTDAGLKVDKWTGAKTWQSLEDLVSFESDALKEPWQAAPERFPAVLRAAQCRMYVLGLVDKLPSKEFKTIRFSGLKKFKRLVIALGGISLDPLEMDRFLNSKKLDGKILNRLMDQDSLVAMVAQSCKPGTKGLEFSYTCDEKTKRPQAYEIRNFFTRLVQVEFWLLGYDIKIVQPLPYPVRGIDLKNKVVCSPKLKKYLEDFAVLSGRKKDIWSRQITPELFVSLVQTEENQNEEAVHARIENRLNTQQAIETALEKGRKFHLRLWDGIKRVIRWIGRLFKKAKESILDLGRTIARFFYKSVQQVFNMVKKAMRIATASLAALDGTTEWAADSFLSVSCDGDVLVGMSDPSDSRNAMRIVKKLRLNAQRFCLAARICAMIVSGLIHTALARWASLAKTLYQNFKECIRIIKKINTLEGGLAALASD